MNKEIRHTIDVLPAEAETERFAIPYTPDTFTPEEERYLNPFFTNLDKPVFVLKNLPAEVKGALASRYSRSTESVRRTFLKEYINPILRPDERKDWKDFSQEEKDEAERTKQTLTEWIDFMDTNGGLDTVVNVQRGRKFFEKWLAQYGDDSIAELGGELVCIEGLSMVATKEIQDQRVGLSPLEKSTRYVQYWEKRPDGEYQYVTPGEIKGTKLEASFKDAMDGLFSAYDELAEPYLEYIKGLYPKGEDETDRSFIGSRSAKRFDDIRDLLPFGTQTSMALYGNGRAFEGLLNRMLDNPVGEVRWWGQGILRELSQVVPSFVERPKTVRGAETQVYRSNLGIVREKLGQEIMGTLSGESEPGRWVSLLSHTPDADVEILTSFVFSAMDGVSMAEVKEAVGRMSEKERAEKLAEVLAERQFGRNEPKREADRFRRVPRAFENAQYMFEMWGRGGDYRDLHRHRQLTQERQRFTTKWGYDLEEEVLQSPFTQRVHTALEKASEVFEQLKAISPDAAQYAVPFGYLQHWYMNMTAREIYWMVELRTGPQGRPHYREICQDIARQATDVSPAVFQGLLTDWSDYSLSRRESEKKIEKKIQAAEAK